MVLPVIPLLYATESLWMSDSIGSRIVSGEKQKLRNSSKAGSHHTQKVELLDREVLPFVYDGHRGVGNHLRQIHLDLLREGAEKGLLLHDGALAEERCGRGLPRRVDPSPGHRRVYKASPSHPLIALQSPPIALPPRPWVTCSLVNLTNSCRFSSVSRWTFMMSFALETSYPRLS